MSAVPAFGQVQGDLAAAVPGGAGGEVDEVAADGSAAGFGIGEAGQGAAARSRLWLMAAEASQACKISTLMDACFPPNGGWKAGIHT